MGGETMLEIIICYLFFAIPLALVMLFGVSLSRYFSAKRKNRLTPGAFSQKEMRGRKIWLIVTAVMAGVTLVVMVGFIALLFMAVAYM